MNKVIILGNLGKDPEAKYTSSGSCITNLTVATNRKYKDASGQLQDETQWHRVVVFGKQAESCAEYLAKGRQVLVEGRIKYDKYEDKEGVTKYTTEIIAQGVQFIGGRNDSDDNVNF
jgi:single-strand DNA-binding protein|tara:strand:+ start:442 stop:792 length:351 start_codon:yes stop_codon:yes gene_type:complete